MISKKIDEAVKVLHESFEPKQTKKNKIQESVEQTEKIVLKGNEDEIYDALSSVLAVGLAQIEDMTGLTFKDSKEAEEFLISAFASLRTKGKSKLVAALRKFDRVGAKRIKADFKRQIK
jgi:hypothetical protein